MDGRPASWILLVSTMQSSIAGHAYQVGSDSARDHSLLDSPRPHHKGSPRSCPSLQPLRDLEGRRKWVYEAYASLKPKVSTYNIPPTAHRAVAESRISRPTIRKLISTDEPP
jgi:hypothetical protein